MVVSNITYGVNIVSGDKKMKTNKEIIEWEEALRGWVGGLDEGL